MWSDDLTQLRSLVAVLDTGSIARAARLTGYSTAAISRHLASLERDLGLALFKRTGRSLTPSPVARAAADGARLVLDEADYFNAQLRTLARGESGVIRFAYVRAAATTLVPMILAEMRRRAPDARVVLIERAVGEDVADLLRSSDADAGTVWGHPAPEPDGLVIEPLLADSLLLLTSQDRDDLHEDPRDLSRLVGEPFSSHPARTVGSPPLVDRLFVEQGLPAPNVTHWLTDHSTAKAYVAAGVVIAMIPALGVSDSSPGVRRSVVVDDFRHIFLARSSGQPHPLFAPLAASVHAAASSYRGLGVRYTGSATSEPCGE